MSELSSPLLSALVGFTPGAIGGTLNCLVGHPMDLIKVRQQTATTSAAATACKNSSLRMLRKLALQEGLPGLYAGVTAPLLAVVPSFAVVFYSFDCVTTLQLRYNNPNNTAAAAANRSIDSLSISQIALAGAVSGVPLALTVGPLERFKCMMQVHPNKYPTFVACVQAVYAQEGVRGLFRGTSATLLRDIPGNAAYFASYEFFKRLLMQQDEIASTTQTNNKMILNTLLAGGLAGMMNWTVAIPMDVLKSKWQTAPSPHTYKHVGCVLRDVLATQGPTALFRGLGPALLRAFPANAACLLGVETARSVLYTTNSR